MKYVKELLYVKFLIFSNKIFFMNKSEKKYKKLELLTLSIVFSFLFFIMLSIYSFLSFIGIKWVYLNFNNWSIANYLGTISLCILYFLLNFSISNIDEIFYRIIKSNDNKKIMIYPITLDNFFLSKILEFNFKEYFKFLFLSIPIIVSSYYIFDFKLSSLFIALSLLILVLIFTVKIKLIIISYIFSLKINKKKLKLTILRLLLFVISLFNILILIFLLIPIALKTSIFGEYFNSISSLHKIISSNFIETYWNPIYIFVNLSFTNSIFLSITFITLISLSLYFILNKLFIKIINNLSIQDTLELITHYNSPQKRIVVINNFFTNKTTNKILSFLNIKIRTLFIKDILFIIRSNGREWLFIFITIISFYIITIISFYYIDIKTDKLNLNNEYMGLSMIIYGNMFVVSTLINRFSFDSEGKSFKNILLLPTSFINITLAKFLNFFLICFPFVLFMSVVAYFVYPINLIELFIIANLSIITFIFSGLLASITFPDFKRESIFHLPTFNARILLSILSILYILFVSLIYYYVKIKFIKIFIIIFISVLIILTYIFLIERKFKYFNS
ncbi:O-antigen polymerase [Bacillus cereus]|uniref:ABC transporter permease n=1 Tax=Bacillus cereus TaxID=1396 RepID=A0A2A7HZY0_BACCE|nr:O-antigen polymerase [Bacillus cereus]PEC22632.1 ABC transporter permease [Bacillus cereus]